MLHMWTEASVCHRRSQDKECKKFKHGMEGVLDVIAVVEELMSI